MNCKVCGKQLTNQKKYCSNPCKWEDMRNLHEYYKKNHGERAYIEQKRRAGRKSGSLPRVKY